MNLYIIRHGDPDYSTDSLTKLGHKQAEKLSIKMKDFSPNEIYSSPFGRAKQTADHCISKWELELHIVEWLRELAWGDKSGNAYSTSSPWIINEDYIKNKGYFPSGDNWKNLPELSKDRLIDDIEERIKKFDTFMKTQGYIRKGQLYDAVIPNDKNIVFFCHGGLGCALLAHLLNISFWHMITHCGLKLTSVSKISFSNDLGLCAPQIEYLNNTDHLPN